MIVIGLTGPIGTGKNTLAQFFQKKGWAIVDVDAVGKSLLKDGEIVEALLKEFGSAVLTPEGIVDTVYLGQKVFLDTLSLNQLNAIMHPRIKDGVRALLAKETKNTIIHAALLFQLELAPLCSLILALKVDNSILVERILKRSSYMNEKMVQNILIRQKKYNDFWDASDIIINNNLTLDELSRKFERLYSQLKEG